MPWQRREIIQFCLILLCVPLQYYLTSFFFDGVKDSDRSQILISIMKNVDSIKEKILNVDLWALNWHDLIVWLIPEVIFEGTQESDGTEKQAESAQTDEELKNNKKEEDDIIVDRILKIRNNRPDYVQYRIGQVVQLKEHAFRGVIIGWEYDEESHSQPIYTILLDESHAKSDMLSVTVDVLQSSLQVIHSQVTNKYILRYFSVFDGSQYIPRDWLKRLYPRD